MLFHGLCNGISHLQHARHAALRSSPDVEANSRIDLDQCRPLDLLPAFRFADEPKRTASMRQLNVRPLTEKRIPQCLPLCRLEIPDLAQDHWESYARDHLSAAPKPSQGILIAEDQRSCILGLLVHGIERDILHGRVLLAKWVIVQDYFPAARHEVALALLSALEDLAERNECRSIQTQLPVPDDHPEPDWLTTVLQTRGQRQDSLRFCKTLTPAR